jgi:hypothetical protein
MGKRMTDEEFRTLSIEVQGRIERLEYVARQVMLDLGPETTAELLQNMATCMRSLKIT